MAPRLHERFPALAETLPHHALGGSATPVREAPELGAWVKDDSRFAEPWGGNKPRKLEWTLADALARGRRTVVTVGGLGTNHGLATALHARQAGLGAALLLADQPVDDHVRGQLERMRASGARLYLTHGKARTIATLPFVLARHRRPYWLGLGGSSPVGCCGFVEAALELGEQVADGVLPEPGRIVVAMGSGGSAAGLMAGLPLAGLRTEVVGVVVNDRTPLDARSVERLARRTLKLLRRRGADVGDDLAPLRVETGFLGGGYGHRLPAGDAATERAASAGISLDPVYTAKAVAALLETPQAGTTLYWHTQSRVAD